MTSSLLFAGLRFGRSISFVVHLTMGLQRIRSNIDSIQRTSANWKCWNRLAHQPRSVHLVSLEWIWSATRCHPFSLDHLSYLWRTSKNCISPVVIVTSIPLVSAHEQYLLMIDEGRGNSLGHSRATDHRRDLSWTHSLHSDRTEQRSSGDLDKTTSEYVCAGFALSSLEYSHLSCISDDWPNGRIGSLRCRIEGCHRAVAESKHPVWSRTFLTVVKYAEDAWWRSRTKWNDRPRYEKRSSVERCLTIVVLDCYRTVFRRSARQDELDEEERIPLLQFIRRESDKKPEEIFSSHFQTIFASSNGRV